MRFPLGRKSNNRFGNMSKDLPTTSRKRLEMGGTPAKALVGPPSIVALAPPIARGGEGTLT